MQISWRIWDNYPDLHIFPVDGKRPVAALSVSVAVDDVEVRHQGRPRVAILTQGGPGVDPVTNLANITQIKSQVRVLFSYVLIFSNVFMKS